MVLDLPSDDLQDYPAKHLNALKRVWMPPFIGIILLSNMTLISLRSIEWYLTFEV